MHVLACGYRLWGFGVKFRIDMSFREYFPLGSWDWARGYGTERAPGVPFLYCSAAGDDYYLAVAVFLIKRIGLGVNDDDGHAFSLTK